MVDLQNHGQRTIEQIWHGLEFKLEVDGKWTGRLSPTGVSGRVAHLTPGQEWINVPLVLEDSQYWTAATSSAPSGPATFSKLLGSGRHTIRVDVDGVVSNPVEIEIVPNESAAERATGLRRLGGYDETERVLPDSRDPAGWGEPLDGLRCRLIPSTKPVPVGTKPMISMEVENTSDKPILWNCASEITLGLSKSAPPSGYAMPKFSVRPGHRARLATAGEVREQFGIGWPDRKDEDPAPNYYRLEPKGRVVLTAECPWEVDKVGPAKIYGVVFRVHPFTGMKHPAEKIEVRCPPLILSVIGAATADP